MLNFGTLNIEKINFGTNQINKICFGDNELWAFVDPILTIVVNGLDDEYEIAVDGEIWPNNQKSFPYGTILEDLTVSISGYTIEPPTIDNIIITGNTSLYFTAIEIPDGDVLLSGATRMILDGDEWSKDGYTYTRNWQGDGSIPYLLEGDGFFGFRYEVDCGVSIYLCGADNFNSGYVGIRGKEEIWSEYSSGANEPISTQPAIGQYVIIRKTGDTVKIQYTTNGTSFTDAMTFTGQTFSNWIYIKEESVGSQPTRKLYDPQGLGLTSR